MTPSETLRRGKKKIEQFDWKPGATAGAMIGHHESHAVFLTALFFLRAAAGVMPGGSLFDWDKTASKEAALAAYDRAIEFALSQETANVG